MSNNPFNQQLDWNLRGKYVWVKSNDGTEYEGWLNRVHHTRGSVLLHDAEHKSTGKDVGTVFIRNVSEIATLLPKKRIERVRLDRVVDHPEHDADYEVKDDIIRMAYRDLWTGSFPTVRELDSGHEQNDTGRKNYQILNGHKRIEAARRAGLKYHPMEVLEVDDETALELLRVAHSED